MSFSTCPVCGWPRLHDPPWTGRSASDEICPSCGTQFGYDDAVGIVDVTARAARHRELRERWVANGARWWSSSRKPPEGWDAAAQLAALEDG